MQALQGVHVVQTAAVRPAGGGDPSVPPAEHLWGDRSIRGVGGDEKGPPPISQHRFGGEWEGFGGLTSCSKALRASGLSWGSRALLVTKASSSLAKVTGSNEWDRQSSSTAKGGGTEMGGS